MTTDRDELGRRLLAAADTVDDSDWDDVLKRAGTEAQPAGGRTRPARPSLRGGGFLVAAAAVVAIGVFVATEGGGSSGVPSASAAAVLDQAAVNTRQYGLPDAIPAGEFWYQEYVARTGTGRTAGSIEKWISRTGSGRWRMTGSFSLDVRFPSASWRGAQTHSHVHLPTQGPWQPYPITGRGLTYQQMLKLPIDPETLLRLLAPRSSTPADLDDQIAFENVAGLLQQPALPAGLRAGLFRALARVPGVQNLGTTTVQGQPGVIVGQLQAGTLQEVIVNPRTGLLLAGRAFRHATVTRTGATSTARGTLIGDTTLVASGLVDSVSKRTAKICWSTRSTASRCQTLDAPSH
jgi:hypothetical protein